MSGEATFATIPHDHWFQPDSIDEEKAKAGRDKMVADNIIYGGSVSYVLFIDISNLLLTICEN